MIFCCWVIFELFLSIFLTRMKTLLHFIFISGTFLSEFSFNFKTPSMLHFDSFIIHAMLNFLDKSQDIPYRCARRSSDSFGIPFKDRRFSVVVSICWNNNRWIWNLSFAVSFSILHVKWDFEVDFRGIIFVWSSLSTGFTASLKTLTIRKTIA